MVSKIYLKLGNIQGDCKDKGHENQIQVMAWSWGISRQGNFDAGNLRMDNSPITNDFTITKWVDDSSPQLLLACCKGEIIDKAIIEIVDDGENPTKKKTGAWYGRAGKKEGFRLTMEQVVLLSVSLNSSCGEVGQNESLYIKFGRFSCEYLSDDDKSAGKKRPSMTWDIIKNSSS